MNASYKSSNVTTRDLQSFRPYFIPLRFMDLLSRHDLTPYLLPFYYFYYYFINMELNLKREGRDMITYLTIVCFMWMFFP